MDAATTAKRKRPAADIASGAATAVDDEVSDGELEEFYAILRRMRDATRRLGAGAGAGARAPPRAPAWRPSFSWEDFNDAPAKQPQPQTQQRPDDERVAENATPPPPRGLDLNVEPPSDAPAAVPAPATPRSTRASA